jgi:hypothetical protein
MQALPSARDRRLHLVIVRIFAGERERKREGLRSGDSFAKLALGLAVRLGVELSIKGDETEAALEPKLRHLGLLDQFSAVIAIFGVSGLIRDSSN